MAHSFHGDLGDHLHDIAIEDESLVRSQDFPWEEVYRDLDNEEPPEQMISMADASSAVAIILGWICQSRRDDPASIATVGAKAESLLLLLDPINSKYKSLADIAEAAGLTRALLSRSLLSLKDQSGLALTIGKLHGSRETYRNVQRGLVHSGRHASEKTRGSSKKIGSQS